MICKAASRSVGLVFLCLSSFTGTMQAQKTGALKGTLLDPTGAAIPNAEISLRWNDVGSRGGVYVGADKHWRNPRQKGPPKKWLQLTTDSSGQFAADLPSGNWDVFAYFDFLRPTCTTVSIETGKRTTLTLRFPGVVPSSLQ